MMALSIKKFEQNLDPKLVERGLHYFATGKVTELESQPHGVWVATVIGTSDYEVEITLDKAIIIDTYCSCPAADTDEYCKHVIATLYAIRDRKWPATTTPKAPKTPKEKKPKKEPATPKSPYLQLQQLAQEAEAKELSDFIISYANRNKEFTARFLLHFKQLRVVAEGTEQGFAELVAMTFKASYVKDRGTNYLDEELLVRNLNPLLIRARKNIGEQNYLEALHIIKAILQALAADSSHIQHNQDREHKLVHDCFELLESIARAGISPMFRDEIFDYCASQSATERVMESGFDTLYDGVLLVLATDAIKRNALLTLLDKKIALLTPQHSKGLHYSAIAKRLGYLETKEQLLILLQRDGEINQLIAENVYYHDKYRHLGVKQALLDKNLGLANQLVRDRLAGHYLKEEGKWSPSTRNQEEWKAYLLEIAIMEGNTAQIQLQATELLREYKSKHYYDVLKQYTPAEDWDRTFRDIELQHFNQPYSFDLLSAIYIAEGRHRDLVELLLKHPYLNNLYNTATTLVLTSSRERFLGIYRRAIVALIERSQASEYIEAVNHMSYLQSIGCGDEVHDWVTSFRSIYMRKTRLLDEMNKMPKPA